MMVLKRSGTANRSILTWLIAFGAATVGLDVQTPGPRTPSVLHNPNTRPILNVIRLQD